MNDLSRHLTEQNLNFSSNPMTADQLGQLVDAIESKALTSKPIDSQKSRITDTTIGMNAKLVLQKIVSEKDSSSTIDDLVNQLGFKDVANDLEEWCSIAIKAQPAIVDAIKSGRGGGQINALIGRVMKLSRGTANANKVKAELLRQLEQ